MEKAIDELWGHKPLIKLEEGPKEITISLEEYKELLIAKGKAEIYGLIQNPIFRASKINPNDWADLNE